MPKVSSRLVVVIYLDKHKGVQAYDPMYPGIMMDCYVLLNLTLGTLYLLAVGRSGGRMTLVCDLA